MLDSTPLLADPAALRRRAAREGYLFFRHFLPVRHVMGMRADILAVSDHHGWRAPGQGRYGGRMDAAAMAAVPDADIRDLGTGAACYREVLKLESFHRFPHHPRLLALYRTLLEDEPLVHPRNIARMILPDRRNHPTPQHQDFPHIQGTAETWTCWVPLGDCPRALGGLTVLRGSYRAGLMPVRPAKGAGGGGFASQLCPGESRWAETDYEAGDILTFHSLTVHKALRSRSQDQIRLSMDIRYQGRSEPIDRSSLGHHLGDLTWEEVYREWKSEDLKYYWQKPPVTVAEKWDPTLLRPNRRIC